MHDPASDVRRIPLLKLSEKSQRCSKNGPTGHRSARFGPGVATRFTPKHYSNTFSDSFFTEFYEVSGFEVAVP